MSLIQMLAAEISFFEVAMSLLCVGLVERAMHMLPAEMVGPGGWLLDTGTED